MTNRNEDAVATVAVLSSLAAVAVLLAGLTYMFFTEPTTKRKAIDANVQMVDRVMTGLEKIFE